MYANLDSKAYVRIIMTVVKHVVLAQRLAPKKKKKTFIQTICAF